MKTAVVFLADGFEECEGLIVVDLLRRAGVEVITASITDHCSVTSSHGITLMADQTALEIDFDSADMIILPGGMPGTLHLKESNVVKEQCLAFARENAEKADGERSPRYLAAICAAPSVFAELGLLEGKKASCHPSVEEQLKGADLSKDEVSVSGNLITSRGLGTAIPFALELVKILADEKTAERIAAGICYQA